MAYFDNPYEQYFYTPDKDYALSSAIYINWAGHRVCDSTHVIGPRVLDTYKIVFVLSGKGYLIQDNHEKILLKANDMFILLANHVHHYWADPDDPWTITWATFNGADSQCLLNAIMISESNYVMRDVLTDSIHSSMSRLMSALADETDLYRLGAVTQLFGIFNSLRQNLKETPQENDQETLVSQLISFIEHNYYTDFDMNTLCDYTHYSRSYLSRKFKNEMGTSIQDYLANTRIRKACNLLLTTSLSVSEVAASVGLNDAMYFSRVFKSRTGHSPTEYRRLFTDAHHLPYTPTSPG